MYLNMIFHFGIAICSASEQQNGVVSSDKNCGQQRKNPHRYLKQGVTTDG